MSSILVPKGLQLTQLQALRNHNNCSGPHPPPMLGLVLSWVLMLQSCACILVPKGLKLTQLQALRNHNATGVPPHCSGPHPPPMLGLVLSWVLLLQSCACSPTGLHHCAQYSGS